MLQGPSTAPPQDDKERGLLLTEAGEHQTFPPSLISPFPAFYFSSLFMLMCTALEP